jgi:hypothetical protein
MPSTRRQRRKSRFQSKTAETGCRHLFGNSDRGQRNSGNEIAADISWRPAAQRAQGSHWFQFVMAFVLKDGH